MPAPPDQPPPWAACVASMGADGAVGLLSLKSGACERLLHAPPGCLPHTLVWDLGRGYLAAMCSQRGGGALGAVWGWAPAAATAGEAQGGSLEGQCPVFVLWDVQAGKFACGDVHC